MKDALSEINALLSSKSTSVIHTLYNGLWINVVINSQYQWEQIPDPSQTCLYKTYTLCSTYWFWAMTTDKQPDCFINSIITCLLHSTAYSHLRWVAEIIAPPFATFCLKNSHSFCLPCSSRGVIAQKNASVRSIFCDFHASRFSVGFWNKEVTISSYGMTATYCIRTSFQAMLNY